MIFWDLDWVGRFVSALLDLDWVGRLVSVLLDLDWVGRVFRDLRVQLLRPLHPPLPHIQTRLEIYSSKTVFII